MMLDILLCVIGWSTIACQAWALKYHFNVEKIPTGSKLISGMVIVSAILLTFLSVQYTQPRSAAWVGGILMIASLVLFWRTIRESSNASLLAAFDADLPHGLLTTGPYRFVRHPFYSSYILHWTGWAIATWQIWAIVPVITMLTIYWVAAGEEEQKFARTEMSGEYKKYRAKTGKFFPKLRM